MPPRARLRPELMVFSAPESEPDVVERDLGGRPTLFRLDYIRIGFNLALLGATEKQMASSFGVTVETLHEWKKTYSQFSDAIRCGKSTADSTVSRSLYGMATGYWGPDGNYYPPQLGAAKHWLAVRQPQKWSVPDPALVNVNVRQDAVVITNVNDQVEAAKQYREFIQLNAPARVIEHDPDDDE